MRTLGGSTHHEVLGIDIRASPFTHRVGSITERRFVRDCIQGMDVVLHTATLHKPHVATHTRAEFIDTNISGTLNLLEESIASNIEAFIFTSTTSVFGHALEPAAGAPAAWITEDVVPIPKNIYGVTKFAAENLCELFRRSHGLPCLILRTSRFFPEEDDDRTLRAAYRTDNLQVNELLYRRVDIEDVVGAHLAAVQMAPTIGFGRYIISATTPFRPSDLRELREDTPGVVGRYAPGYERQYLAKGWSMLPAIDRVYVNDLARSQLGWQPQYDFARAIAAMDGGEDHRSPLARAVGSKGYHAKSFADGPYPV